MFLARFGPVFVKYSEQKRFAISLGLEISRLSILKVEGNLFFWVFLFIISFSTLHVLFMCDLAFSIFFS